MQKCLRIRELCEPAVENGSFEARKRSNLTQVGALTNIEAHEVVSETVKNSLCKEPSFLRPFFSATLAQVKPRTKFGLFGDSTLRANIVEMVSGETILLSPKRPNLVHGFT